jgi:hypothetical protein
MLDLTQVEVYTRNSIGERRAWSLEAVVEGAPRRLLGVDAAGKQLVAYELLQTLQTPFRLCSSLLRRSDGGLNPSKKNLNA